MRASPAIPWALLVLRGVLLVIAAACAGAQRTPSPQAINESIDRGLEALRTEVAGGEANLAAGITPLVLYAMVKSGAEQGEPAVNTLLASMVYADYSGSYDRACAILALDALDRVTYQEWILELANGLLEDQNEHGGWGYPQGEDLSNIQYAVLGLWAAMRSGFEVPAKTWRSLARRIPTYSRRGGFGYQKGKRPTGSMTAAGVGVLAILDAQEGVWEPRGDLRKVIDKKIKSSLSWLGKNFTVKKNPSGEEKWTYYYLYGLERVGAFAGVREIGKHDWYREGAEQLLRNQKPNGLWPGGVVDSSFALLFLSRATGPLTGESVPKGPLTGRKADGNRQGRMVTGSGSPMTLVASGDSPLRLWIAGWGQEAMKELVWAEDGNKGPRVLRVEYLPGSSLLATVEGDADAPAGAQRFPTQHVFREPGVYEVLARAYVLPPPVEVDGQQQPSQPVMIESEALSVRIEDIVSEWLVEQRAERKYVLRDAQHSVKVSSYYGGGDPLPDMDFQGRLALDGKQRTAWLAGTGDKRPTLSLSYASPIVTDGLRIYGARSTPHVTGAFARPLEVQVQINGTEPVLVRMHVDERRAGSLDWDHPRLISTLSVSIPATAPGLWVPVTGLAEVQLLRRP